MKRIENGVLREKEVTFTTPAGNTETWSVGEVGTLGTVQKIRADYTDTPTVDIHFSSGDVLTFCGYAFVIRFGMEEEK